MQSGWRTLTKITLFLLVLVSPFLSYAVSLNDAYQDYLCGEFEEALSKAQKLRPDDAVLYFTGLAYTKLGYFGRGRMAFQKVLEHYPRSEFYVRSLVKVADTYFLEGDYAKAADLYKQLENKAAAADFASLICLRLAQIAGKQGDWAGKKKYLKLVKSKYSRCIEAKFADVIEGYGDSFSIQVGAFSNRNNALGLKKELEKDYEVDVVTDNASGYRLYKVRVGSFKQRRQAEKVYFALLEQGYPARIYP